MKTLLVLLAAVTLITSLLALRVHDDFERLQARYIATMQLAEDQEADIDILQDTVIDLEYDIGHYDDEDAAAIDPR